MSNLGQKKPSLRYLATTVSICVVMTCGAAFSQNKNTSLPDISVPPMDRQADRDSTLNPDNFTEFQLRNKYLDDKIKLQYQIALINNLIEWQKQVQKIEEAYAAIGVNFDQAKPARAICEQVPINLPCYRAYPDLYPAMHAEVEQQRKEIVDEAVEAAKQRQGYNRVVAEARAPEGVAAFDTEQRQKAVQKERSQDVKTGVKSDFEWLEVFCLSGECQAVITRITDPDYRLTVSLGDALPDGSEISKIQPGRLEASKDGNIIVLKPAPLDNSGRTESDLPSLRDLQKTFNENFPGANGNTSSGAASPMMTAPSGANDGNNDSRESTPLDDLPPLGVEDDLPPVDDSTGLGTTGLF